jgi:hypothetical protein
MSEIKVQKGKYRWAIERKSGKVEKYDEDDAKTVYHWKDNMGNLRSLDRTNIKTWGATDDEGATVAVMDVPVGAVVFQRRRIMDINFNNQFHTAEEVVPAGPVGGRWFPERKVVKTYPEYTYSEVYLVGWRKRDGNVVTVHFKAVYPDGKVEEYDAFNMKPWLDEPDWFTEEQV